jgi:hypothetical protein
MSDLGALGQKLSEAAGHWTQIVGGLIALLGTGTVVRLGWEVVKYLLDKNKRVHVRIRKAQADDDRLCVDVTNSSAQKVQVRRLTILHLTWHGWAYKVQAEPHARTEDGGLPTDIDQGHTTAIWVSLADIDGHHPDVFHRNGGQPRNLTRPVKVQVQLGTLQWKTTFWPRRASV